MLTLRPGRLMLASARAALAMLGVPRQNLTALLFNAALLAVCRATRLWWLSIHRSDHRPCAKGFS